MAEVVAIQTVCSNTTVDTSFPSRVFLGKMLRINVDTITGSLNYGIPPTNPYAGQSWNSRNLGKRSQKSWKFSFNRLNGDLWIADVGQNIIEEVNKIESLYLTLVSTLVGIAEGNASYSSSGTCPLYAATVAQFRYIRILLRVVLLLADISILELHIQIFLENIFLLIIALPK
jgi:hypothetical protein